MFLRFFFYYFVTDLDGIFVYMYVLVVDDDGYMLFLYILCLYKSPPPFSWGNAIENFSKIPIPFPKQTIFTFKDSISLNVRM